MKEKLQSIAIGLSLCIIFSLVLPFPFRVLFTGIGAFILDVLNFPLRDFGLQMKGVGFLTTSGIVICSIPTGLVAAAGIHILRKRNQNRDEQ